MYTYTDESELAFLKRFWDDLTTEQRSNVIEKFYQSECLDEEILEEVLLKCEIPHVEDFPIPEYPQCMDMLLEMTQEETQKLVTYTGFSIPELKEAIQDSDVLFNVLQNYLARNYKLDLPPVEIFVIPDRYEIPFKIRRASKTRLHIR